MKFVTHTTLAFALMASLASIAHAQTAISPDNPEEKLTPAKTADELQLRYLSVLAALKNPAVTGLLVAELGPYSNAANAGVRPGDIIVEYLGRRLDDPKDKDRNTLLRNLVTRAIDEQGKKDINPLATFIVHRGGKLHVLAAERMPLGIFTVPVEKGVVMPLNPVESERGSFKTTWNSATTILCVGEVKGETAGAASIEKHSFGVSPPNAGLGVTAKALVKIGVPAQKILDAKFNFTVTNRSISPAIALDDFTFTDESVNVSAERKGGVIRGTINRKLAHIVEKVDLPTLAEAVPTLAIPHLASTLPLEANIVLQFAVINEVDLQTRLGYALETRGKVKIKIDPREKAEKPAETKPGDQVFRKEKEQETEIEAFAVRLWHFGQLDSTFYFNDKRQLLSVTSDAGGPTMSRAESETDALKSLVIIKDPASTRPLFPREPAPGEVKIENQDSDRAISPDGEKR